MLFMVLAWDHADDEGVARRDAQRAAHTTAITERFEAGQVVLGAGIYDDDGVVRGSLVVLDAADRAEVDAYLASEPFATGEVWERIEVRSLRVPDRYLQKLGPVSPSP